MFLIGLLRYRGGTSTSPYRTSPHKAILCFLLPSPCEADTEFVLMGTRELLNEWIEVRRREWYKHVTRIDAERLVKNSIVICLPEDLQDIRKEVGQKIKTGRIAYNIEEEKRLDFYGTDGSVCPYSSVILQIKLGSNTSLAYLVHRRRWYVHPFNFRRMDQDFYKPFADNSRR